MSIQALQTELSELGVKLVLKEDKNLSVVAPKGSLSDSLLDRLRQNKAELIKWLTANDSGTISASLPIIRPDLENLALPFPSADLQTAFLMGDNEDMEFHVRPHYYLEEELEDIDVERYEKALNAALYRQRANLVVVNEDILLQALPTFTPIKVKVLDLRGLPPGETGAALERTRAEMSREILPLDHWPWFDCRISLYGEGKARLHYNNNNVFSDGYGTQKLLTDAMHNYRHPDQPLPDLTLSFRDCVHALNQLEESPLGQASRRYWSERLPYLPGPPPLPLKPGADPHIRSRLIRREMILPENIWTGFKNKARFYGLTPTNALFAAYAEVISCWSGSRHFLLNNMVTHRFPMHPEVKEIIGNFASLYPLEVDWRANEPFFQRARKLQERVMTDLQHVYWSGVKVLQALNQVQKTPGKAPCPFVVGSGLFMKPYKKPYVACLETPQVVLDHQFWDLADGGLWMVWDLIETIFPDGMIDAMWEAYRKLLAEFAEDGQAWSKIDFDLLPPVQRQQRIEVNRTEEAVPTGLLHESLAVHAARNPDKPAVVTQNFTLTYGELQIQANCLAQRLLSAGIGRNELVAVMLDKGWEQAVAVFGILSAGAAYVPIDPEWPPDRIHYLLGNIKAKVVVTRRSLSEGLNLPGGVQAVCIDKNDPGQYPRTPVTAAALPHDLAYIIFTSGSTGMPKGVMVDHRGALNTVMDINRRFGITERDVIYGISALYFDLSVYDLFGTVAAGATLVQQDASAATAPEAWIEAIRSNEVSVWNSVPALMQLLVDAAKSSGIALTSLRTVMLSGDWIPVSLPDQIRRVAPNARVISLGGATEASIWSIHYPIERPDNGSVSIPYGRPLANQHWHVLDENGKDAPIWVPGHLYIGGIGLARGYWQDPAKTEAAFVQHRETGARLYRTGDLGRYLPDGNIEFLGRSDFQVKIQGFRIELGEIEQALLSHPGIRAATVIANATGAGKQLLAFIVPEAGSAALTGETVQSFLLQKLPRYMVPGQVSVLEQLPLTANGKVDRKALAKMGENAQQQKQAYAPARTKEEAELVAIWEEVLGISPIGINDDFFEAGGQSFAAVRMMTRIGRQFGRRLPLSVLLEGRTIAHLANNLQHSKAWTPLVPVHLNGKQDRPCFFVHPAGGNVLCYRNLAENLGRPFYGLQAAGLSGEQPVLDEIEHMAALYVQAIRHVQPAGPYLLGGWSSGGVIAFEMARQLEREGQVVEGVVMLDTPAPLQHDAVNDAVLLKWFLEDLNIGIDSSRIEPHEIEGAEQGRQLTVFLPLLMQRQQLDVELDPHQLELIYAVFRGIIKACRKYHPTPILSPISVLRAEEGRVSEFLGHPADHVPDWGWSSFTLRGATSATIPGSHYTILSPQHGDVLVTELKRQLSSFAVRNKEATA